jgi:hypothetical protein
MTQPRSQPTPPPATPDSIEGKVRNLTVNDRRQELIFTVRDKEGDHEVFTSAYFDSRLKDDAPAFVAETLYATGRRERFNFYADDWRLLFHSMIPRNIGVRLVQERGMITQQALFETLIAADGTWIGTLEVAPQSSCEPTLFGGKDGKPPYAYAVGWLLARTKDLRGNPKDVYKVIVEVSKVETATAARLARRQLFNKALDYAQSLIPKFSYKMRVVESNRLEDPGFPDALPPEIK